MVFQESKDIMSTKRARRDALTPREDGLIEAAKDVANGWTHFWTAGAIAIGLIWEIPITLEWWQVPALLSIAVVNWVWAYKRRVSEEQILIAQIEIVLEQQKQEAMEKLDEQE